MAMERRGETTGCRPLAVSVRGSRHCGGQGKRGHTEQHRVRVGHGAEGRAHCGNGVRRHWPSHSAALYGTEQRCIMTLCIMTLSEVTRAELSEDVAGGCGRGLPPPVTSELPGNTLSVMLAAAPVPRRGLC